MNTTNITNNPWNKIETLAEHCHSTEAETVREKGLKNYRRAQIILSATPEGVEPEAWIHMARIDLAMACWAFHAAEDADALQIAMDLGARLV